MIRTFSVLSVLSLVISASAFAMPAVGDAAQFDLDATVSGSHYVGTVDLSLTEFNAANQQFKQKTVINVAGQTQNQEEWVKASDLVTDALIASALGNCAAYGGALETIVVGAGSFSTCSLPYDNEDSSGRSWIGNATFGIIKQDNTNKKNGQHTVLTLKSYHPGA
jgi:hypothetical protein